MISLSVIKLHSMLLNVTYCHYIIHYYILVYEEIITKFERYREMFIIFMMTKLFLGLRCQGSQSKTDNNKACYKRAMVIPLFAPVCT